MIQQFPFRYKLLIRDPILIASFFLAMMLAAIAGYAQAPKISYAGPQVYTAFTAISPLSPSNTGDAVATPTPVKIGTVNYKPFGIAVDNSGNVYVADFIGSTITKIPAGGGPQTAVGSGFADPTGVAVDASGNIYVADYGNNAVKEIPAGGGPVVALGSGFNAPFGIALDAAGNIYVSENVSSGDVKKMPAGGGTPVVIGNGFNHPKGIAADSKGNVFIEDTGNSKLKEIPAAGGGPVAIDPAFSSVAVAVDANDILYVADNQPNYNSYQILRIPAINGNPGSFADFSAVGLAVDASYNVYAGTEGPGNVYKINPGGYYINPALPAGLSFNNSTGVISGTATVSSPATNYNITAYNSSGHSSATVNITVNAYPPPTVSYASPQSYPTGAAITPLSPGGSGVAAAGYSGNVYTIAHGFNSRQLAVDAAGNVYVAENIKGTVNKIPAGGGAAVVVGSGFSLPRAVAVDAAGNIYVGDGNGLKEIPAGGGPMITLLTEYQPHEMALDAAGNIYAVDDVSAIKVPAGGGAPVTLYTHGGGGGPTGVALDGCGNVYLADGKYGKFVKVPASGGAPVTYANYPTGSIDLIAMDATGNLFYSYGSASIGEIPAGGGSPVTIGSGFSNTQGVAVDGAGVVYIADNGNSAVKKVKPSGGYYLNKFLPGGLTLNNNTGVISGTPTAITPATNYTVTAYNIGNNARATVNIQTTDGTDELANLQLSSGSLSPAFSRVTYKYTASVANNISSITVTPTLVNTSELVLVNGTAVSSGSPSGNIALSVGANAVYVTVTSHGISPSRTDTVTITRAASGNANLSSLSLTRPYEPLTATTGPGFKNYTASVSESTASIEVVPVTADPTATVKVNGITVASGSASAPVPLAGGNTTITTVVTAQDGLSTNSYIITVNRPASNNASLSSLSLTKPYAALTTVSGPDYRDYTASVTNAATSIEVLATTADPTATVKVNGITVASGSATAPIALAVGANTITTKVTAQDGISTKSYVITVTRQQGH